MFFGDIPGQEALKKQLATMAQQERVPHALLFTEKSASGGLALAIAFARRLLCTSPNANDGCGNCSSCKQINQFAHPDLIFSFPIIKKDDVDNSETYGAQWRNALIENPFLDHDDWLVRMDGGSKLTLIGVAEASRLIRQCSLKRFNSRYRVVIIWLPEKMNITTANKLLKLLEEPAEGTLFFLVSRTPGQLLTTILSRCQLMPLLRTPESALTPFLLQHGATEERTASVCARFSEGDISQAIRLVRSDQSIERFADWFVRWTRICYAAKLNDLIDWSAELHKATKDELVAFLRFVASLFEESLRVKHDLMAFEHPAFQRVEFKMKVFSNLMSQSALLHMRQELDEAVFAVQRNITPRLLLFHLGVQMMRSFKMKE